MSPHRSSGIRSKQRHSLERKAKPTRPENRRRGRCGEDRRPTTPRHECTPPMGTRLGVAELNGAANTSRERVVYGQPTRHRLCAECFSRHFEMMRFDLDRDRQLRSLALLPAELSKTGLRQLREGREIRDRPCRRKQAVSRSIYSPLTKQIIKSTRVFFDVFREQCELLIGQSIQRDKLHATQPQRSRRIVQCAAKVSLELRA